MKRFVLILLLALPLGAAPKIPAFDAPRWYPVGLNPTLIAAGDFNGDGLPDLAEANIGDGTISVLLNSKAGFRAQAVYTVGGLPLSVAVGDFNGDGKLDLAVANQKTNAVGIMLGNGDGTFQSQVSY